MIKNTKIFARDGFTLTELLVAMSVFIVGITLTIGAFVSTLKTQRAVTHLMSVNSNASLVLEQIAREIRTGYSFNLNNYSFGSCIGESRDEIVFTNARNNQVTYRREGTALLKQECSGDDCDNSAFNPVTATDVSVDRLCFRESRRTATSPWKISTFLRVGSTNPELSNNFINLETTITSRVLPCDVLNLPQCPL